MKLMEWIEDDGLKGARTLFEVLQKELAEGLRIYWSSASRILEDSGIRLQEPPPDFTSLKRNFFSALFLTSYYRAGIPGERRIAYAAINQCLRGMVTGCDNLLDDEYKPTLRTDLPETGVKFRSVLDIMVSDRVLFEILLKSFNHGELSAEQLLAASSATLRALTRSGAQEAAEEGGVQKILEPREILTEVHHYKTGLLFQCPWAVPRLIENLDENASRSQMEALFRIGMGCQIMDDMVDFPGDISRKHHNYIVSLAHHGAEAKERARLQALYKANPRAMNADLAGEFPVALKAASETSRKVLREGLKVLFPDELQSLADPIITTLAALIGADRFMTGVD